ncbi:MAG: bifunctional UDP-N-acetylglucosamine pyrophosphorylase / glucosamine-phosphate N-acetyltransferase [Chloroflexota bacterium]|nr:bifunctional UDP-N-acetylglucosamine pyrophosphorylase / glucosamine-phosphate N-acetyltransferase [Chloroflexota bacterium]
MSPKQPKSAVGGSPAAVTRRGARAVAVILAAGLGTRMKSRTPKVLHPICGRPMLAYVIDAAREATGQKPLVVYSPPTDAMREAFAKNADFALQKKPQGTGDALAAAVAALPADAAEIVVLSGDVPLIEAGSVKHVLEVRREYGAPMAAAVVEMEDPTGYGRVQIGSRGTIRRIIEDKDTNAKQRDNHVINAGLYAFDVAWLRTALPRLTKSPTTGELYLTQLVELAAADGRPAVAVDQPAESDWESELVGINDRADLAEVQLFMQYSILQRLMEEGITLQDPGSLTIEAEVRIAPDVTIEPNVILRGATKIGRDTVIKAGSQLIDATIGERCQVWASVIEGSEVGNDVKIGPFAHLRGGCLVGDGAEIGNFAEQKNTRFGTGSKQHHFSYLGDAEIGKKVNIGAGTITANYDGERKHKTVIGDGAFIGSDTILRAPLTVGKGAYTGAGSVVTKDVPPGKLAVGVPARIRERLVRKD